MSDDGPGFDVAATHGGDGLRNMADRLGAVHGRLAIVSSPGNGTLITGVVPIGVTADAAASGPARPLRDGSASR